MRLRGCRASLRKLTLGGDVRMPVVQRDPEKVAAAVARRPEVCGFGAENRVQGVSDASPLPSAKISHN